MARNHAHYLSDMHLSLSSNKVPLKPDGTVALYFTLQSSHSCTPLLLYRPENLGGSYPCALFLRSSSAVYNPYENAYVVQKCGACATHCSDHWPARSVANRPRAVRQLFERRSVHAFYVFVAKIFLRDLTACPLHTSKISPGSSDGRMLTILKPFFLQSFNTMFPKTI